MMSILANVEKQAVLVLGNLNMNHHISRNCNRNRYRDWGCFSARHQPGIR